MSDSKDDYFIILNDCFLKLKIIEKNLILLSKTKLLVDFLKLTVWIIFENINENALKTLLKCYLFSLEYLIRKNVYSEQKHKELKTKKVLLDLFYLSNYVTPPESVFITDNAVTILKDHVTKTTG